MNLKLNGIIALILFLSFPSSRVSAQLFSFEGGYIATNYRNMLPFTNPKGGFQMGVGYAKPIKDSGLFVKTGLYYQQLDAKGTIDYFNQVNQVVLSFQKSQELYYLQIPVLMQLEKSNWERIKIGVQAGLSFNYRLRAWQNPQPREVAHNVTHSFRPFVLGYQVGASATYQLSPSWGLQFLYQYGASLSSVQKQNNQSGFAIHSFTLGVVGSMKQIF